MSVLVEGKSAVFERDGFVYFVSTCSPFEPADSEIDEFSFASEMKAMAPNPHLLWLHGTYCEAGHPVDHGDHAKEWMADDLSIKSLTPVFMPVTVMHDPRSAVGLIADTKLVPGSAEGPTRIDNALALWAHRFPEVAEESMANHRRGTLMQSQECRPAYWECGPCGQRFLEKTAIEQHQHSEHSVLNGKPNRKLGNVTFTGTGLIFGTRGVRGALASAQLDVLAEEVSEFHERSRTDRPGKAATRRTSAVDIEQKDYEALVTKAGKADDLEARLRTAEEASAKVPDLEKKIEALEVAKKAADDDLSKVTKEKEDLEEQSRAADLSADRMGKLGDGFKTKLPDSIKAKLEEQSKSHSDEDWTARLDELSELLGVKPDAAGESGEDKGGEKGKSGSGSQEFSREETSRSGAGAGGGAGAGTGDPSRTATSQVVGGVLRRLNPQPSKKEPAGSGQS